MNNAPVSGLRVPTEFDIFVQSLALNIHGMSDASYMVQTSSELMHKTYTQTPILRNVCISYILTNDNKMCKYVIPRDIKHPVQYYYTYTTK